MQPDRTEQACSDDVRRMFEIGVRVALEKILTGRDYAGVEDILRELSNRGGIPVRRSPPPADMDVAKSP